MNDADAEARVKALADPTDDLVALVKTGESEAAAYYLAVVVREHPEEAGQTIVMERYAQLAASWSKMSDTWLKNGINRRAPADDLGDFARGLASAYAGLAAQADADTLGDRDVTHVDADPEA